EDLAAWADLGVLALAVVNDRGEEVVRAQLKDPEVRRRVAAALAPADRSGSPGVLALPGPGGPLLRFRVPLAAGGGALRLVADGAPLADAVRSQALGEAADLVLARRDGTVVLGSAPSLAGFAPSLVAAALSGQVLGASPFRDRRGERVIGAYAPV